MAIFLLRNHLKLLVKIESMHWLLDVVFYEDEGRFLNENAHLTLNILCKFALMKHKNFLNEKKRKLQ